MTMIIDFHSHIYPEDVAPKVLASTKNKVGIEVFGSGTPQGLKADMRKAGIEKAVVLPVAKTPGNVRPINDWIKSLSGDGLLPFGAIHPLMEGLEEELDLLAYQGFPGVKVVPVLQRLCPDGPRCYHLYEALVARNMILVAHAGRAPTGESEAYGTPERFAEVAETFPDLKIVLTHLGGLRMWDEVRESLLPSGKNVYFDSSYASFYLSPEEMAGMIREIGIDRVLFGTDYPWADASREIALIRSLGFSAEEMESIFHGTAERLIGGSIP